MFLFFVGNNNWTSIKFFFISFKKIAKMVTVTYQGKIKIFIYLTDVTKEAGPHSFVATTHKYKKFSHIVAERIDDKEIRNTYSAKKVKIFCGEKGQVILEDTFGLHKGVTPTKKSRIMLILYFGPDSGFDMYRYPLVKKL